MELRERILDFPGKCVPAAAASVVDGPWALADTSAAGAPVLAAAGGLMVGTLAATDEVENVCLYMGDALAYDIDDLHLIEFIIKASAGYAAAASLAFGLASARNDAIDSLAAHASFRLLGNADGLNHVYCETDDGTNDVDDKDTGLYLVATLKRFRIDFASGLVGVSPPPSKGGKANVLFSMDDARGNLVPVCRSTRFNMENYSAGLQPYVQIQKTGGATTPSFSLHSVRIVHKLAV